MIAFVPQDHHLIFGTVAENIDFYRGLARSELVQAAKAAHLHDDILRLSDGYDTILGGGRGDLSGGQRQRLSIARALAGHPHVLVLDEPTAALISDPRDFVQDTLVQLRGQLTLFVVAHRVSTMAVCDRIMVLEEGKLCAIGSHAQVVSESPFYRQAVGLASRTAGDDSPALEGCVEADGEYSSCVSDRANLWTTAVSPVRTLERDAADISGLGMHRRGRCRWATA